MAIRPTPPVIADPREAGQARTRASSKRLEDPRIAHIALPNIPVQVLLLASYKCIWYANTWVGVSEIKKKQRRTRRCATYPPRYHDTPPGGRQPASRARPEAETPSRTIPEPYLAYETRCREAAASRTVGTRTGEAPRGRRWLQVTLFMYDSGEIVWGQFVGPLT